MGLPAAAQRDRRRKSRSRPSSAPAPDRARAAPRRPAPAGPSKLASARRGGIRLAALTAGALVLVLLGVAVLATGSRGERLLAFGRQVGDGAGATAASLDALARGQFAGLGLRVNTIRLDGASSASQGEILKAIGVKPGSPILGLDLAAIRARVEQVGWVANASVERLFPGTLVVSVRERPLLAIWQVAGRQSVIASNGQIVNSVAPARVGALPLVVGVDANTHAAEILPLIAARPRLASRVSALRRVDGRRWDIILKSRTVILLPAGEEDAALSRLDRLDAGGNALELGLARIDLRNRNLTVVRPFGSVIATQTKTP